LLEYLSEELETEKQRADTLAMYLSGETQLMANIGSTDSKGFASYQKHRARLFKRLREIEQPSLEKPKTIWERLKPKDKKEV